MSCFVPFFQFVLAIMTQMGRVNYVETQIIYFNYYSTMTQLVSEKTLLDETKTSDFCFLTVYVRVVKAIKCR